MTSLKSRIQGCARAQFALTAALVVFTILFYALAYRPRQAYVQQLGDEISLQREQWMSRQLDARRLPDVQASLQKLQVEMAGIDSLPATSDAGNFVKQVGDLANQCGVQNLQVAFPNGGSTSDRFRQYPIQLKFQGDFLKAFDFLRRLESIHRLARPNEIAIHSLDPAAGTVEVDMSLDAYFAER